MATLNKYGVPLGIGGVDGRGGILQPKLKYRFRVRTINFGGPAGVNVQVNLTQQVMNVTKPQINYEEVQLDSYISRAWVAGKHTWQPITLTVRDDITNSVSKLVGFQNQKQVNHFEQTAPAAGENYKFTMFIDILDGGNVVVQESWYVEGCWLQDINYDSLDYATSDVQIITMSIRFDNATQSEGLMPRDPSSALSDGVFSGPN